MGLLGGRERAAGRRSVHKAVVIVIVNSVKGTDFEMQEVVAEGTDAHKMRTGPLEANAEGSHRENQGWETGRPGFSSRPQYYLAT